MKRNEQQQWNEQLQGGGAQSDVLIVGAGPTGLVLACDLARRGVRALVVERSPELFPGSRGKGIQPRTLEVFDDLGVLGEVLRWGGPAPVGMTWTDGNRAGEYRIFDDVEPTEDAPYTGPWVLPQWRTQRILFDRLRELGGDVVFGAELTDLTQHAESVTATLVPAGGGSPVTVRAGYVVAADGGRSTVRRLTGIKMTGERVDPAPLLVADVVIPALDRDNWHIFPPAADGTGFATLCPLPHTREFQLVARPAAAGGEITGMKCGR